MAVVVCHLVRSYWPFSLSHTLSLSAFLSAFLSFLLGGMDELTLEQIKTKSDLEEDIDFENSEINKDKGNKDLGSFLADLVLPEECLVLLKLPFLFPQIYSLWPLDLKLIWTSVIKVCKKYMFCCICTTYIVPLACVFGTLSF